MNKLIPSYPLFPFLYIILTIVWQYVGNVSEVAITVIVRPILVISIISGLLFFMLQIYFRNIHFAGLLLFGFLFGFLNYGLIYQILRSNPLGTINLGHHIITGLLFLIINATFLFFLLKYKNSIDSRITRIINISIMFLLLVPLLQLSLQMLSLNSSPDSLGNRVQEEQQTNWIASEMQPLAIPSDGNLPDIYYIIPDMFARHEAILDETGLDNSDFLSTLEGLGFYVANCSRSNYASTQLSITSSLNIHYLDEIQTELTDRPMLMEPMRNSLIRSSLEDLGYSTVVLDNGFGLDEIPDADYFLSLERSNFITGNLSPFEGILVRNSFLRVFYDIELGVFSDMYDRLFFPYWEHVESQQFILEQLPDIQVDNGPMFVFAHIMVPHPPFLFREDGSIETDSSYYRESLGQPINEELYLQGYRRQVVFLQDQLISIITELITEADTEPIIVIQGDHGIRDENRLNILNAYYVPANIINDLYPNITPVNSFRIIFNGIFQTNYRLLPDRSYYSVYPDWFDMEISPEYFSECN